MTTRLFRISQPILRHPSKIPNFYRLFVKLSVVFSWLFLMWRREISRSYIFFKLLAADFHPISWLCNACCFMLYSYPPGHAAVILDAVASVIPLGGDFVVFKWHLKTGIGDKNHSSFSVPTWYVAYTHIEWWTQQSFCPVIESFTPPTCISNTTI